MTWGLVAVAGATLVGGVVASNASGKAANAQIQGADAAAQVQREGLAQQQAQFDQSRQDTLNNYNTSRADTAPYRDVGQNALLALSDQLGIARPAGMEGANTGNPQFQTDPGYQFAFDQGLKAVDARFPGMSKSGAKAKALTTYGQGVADQQYGNWLSRLSSLASVGQTATGQAASLGANTTNALNTIGSNNSNAIGANAANTGNLLENAAASRASGYVGSANAISGGINSLAQYAGTYLNSNASSGAYNPAMSQYANWEAGL